MLSRKPREALRIGEDVEVTVVEVKGDMVRIGIQAPRDIQVWRRELWEAIVAENIAAAGDAVVPKIPVIKPKAGIDDLLVKKREK